MTINAHQTGPGSLLIGDDPGTEFAVAITSATLEPSVDTEDDQHVLSGDVLPGADEFTWALSVTMFQDFDAGGLTDYLFTHRGEVMPFVFRPSNAHERGWTGSIKIRPMSIGGDVRKRNTSDVEFPLVGEPTITTETVGG